MFYCFRNVLFGWCFIWFNLHKMIFKKWENRNISIYSKPEMEINTSCEKYINLWEVQQAYVLITPALCEKYSLLYVIIIYTKNILNPKCDIKCLKWKIMQLHATTIGAFRETDGLCNYSKKSCNETRAITYHNHLMAKYFRGTNRVIF